MNSDLLRKNLFQREKSFAKAGKLFTETAPGKQPYKNSNKKIELTLQPKVF
jgi:hypothetical protein